MALKEDLKALIIKSGWSMTDVVSEINKRNETETSLQNFSGKLSRGSFKYSEVEEILGIIGYKIEWLQKE